jgi:hypothetical protein
METLGFSSRSKNFRAQRGREFCREGSDEFLKVRRHFGVRFLQLGRRIVKQLDEVIVGGGHAINEIFKDDGELLDEFAGFFTERKGGVAFGSEVEVLERDG